MQNQAIFCSAEVQSALQENRPVVALESTIIAHGMPFPQNVETALRVEKTIRDAGAIPATCAIIGGKLMAGLHFDQIELLGKEGANIPKASRRDLAYLVSQGKHGATTVASTMILAHLAGIQIFATGGIGGVHRGATTTMDISADLQELARTPLEIAKLLKKQWEIGLYGVLIANPVAEEHQLDAGQIEKAILEAVAEAEKQGIKGKAITPFLLAKIENLTGGKSLQTNINLVLNNARLGAEIAVAFCGGG